MNIIDRPNVNSGTRLMATMAAGMLLVIAIGCESGQNRSNSNNPGYSEAPDPARDGFVEGADRPPTPRTLYAMSRLLVGQSKDQQATFVLRRVIAEHPDYEPAYNALAEIYMRSDRIDLAIQTLDAGLERTPRSAILLNNRGMCALIEEDYKAAADYFAQAVEAQPDGRFQANEALALALDGNYDQALEAYRRAVPPATAYYNVAVVAEARDDVEYAAEAFRQAEALSPRGRSPGR